MHTKPRGAAGVKRSYAADLQAELASMRADRDRAIAALAEAERERDSALVRLDAAEANASTLRARLDGALQ